MRQGQLQTILGYLHRVASPDGGGPGDAHLLDRWRDQRDPAAFEVLVWRHGSMVWNVCRRLLGREQDVEDAFQATFLTFLRKADTIGHGRFLGSWLYKVAYRTALAARTTSARHTVHGQLDSDLPEAAAEDGWDEIGPVLDEEVNRLPEKYRHPFVLCYLEGKTTDEAARDLGCPRGTVGTRLAWARERLRSRLMRRGLALSSAGLAALLTEKASAASVPAPLVASMVKAATFSEAGIAGAAGVLSARAAALSQSVLQALFVAKLKTVALVLVVVGVLGSGAWLFARQTLTGKNEVRQIAEGDKPVDRAREANPLKGDTRERPDDEEPPAAKEDVPAVAETRDEKSDPLHLSGKVVQVDGDGKGFGLKILSKGEGKASRKDVLVTDRTELVFSNVGPDEARLTEGYTAEVWLERDRKDAAARVHLNGNRNIKNAPSRTGRVIAAAPGGDGVTLERAAKGEPTEKFFIRFTRDTRVSFANVARDGARITEGYEGRVWVDKESPDVAASVTFFGTAEGKSAEGKDRKPDQSGRIVGLSSDGKVLTVELPAVKGGRPTTTEIKLTDATRESYLGVAADRAKPAAGYQVQAWLAEGSRDTAARVRFSGDDLRKTVDGEVLAVASDGGRLTLTVAPRVKGGEPARLEITNTAKTRLLFANVGPGGARLTEGYRVRGWLAPGSDDTADELLLSRSEKTNGK